MTIWWHDITRGRLAHGTWEWCSRTNHSHLSVRENIGLGSRSETRWDKRKTMVMSSRVRLRLAGRYPHLVGLGVFKRQVAFLPEPRDHAGSFVLLTRTLSA